jgi:hypothetical protein
MTRNDEALTYADLLAQLGDDGTKELFRRLLEEALQELIDAEFGKCIRSGGSCPGTGALSSDTELKLLVGDLCRELPTYRVEGQPSRWNPMSPTRVFGSCEHATN